MIIKQGFFFKRSRGMNEPISHLNDMDHENMKFTLRKN